MNWRCPYCGWTVIKSEDLYGAKAPQALGLARSNHLRKHSPKIVYVRCDACHIDLRHDEYSKCPECGGTLRVLRSGE